VVGMVVIDIGGIDPHPAGRALGATGGVHTCGSRAGPRWCAGPRQRRFGLGSGERPGRSPAAAF
jgi:hypothetical protein